MQGLEQMVQFMTTHGIAWASRQRDAHRPRGRAMTSGEREVLSRFFSKETLDEARVVFVPQIDNPDFFVVFTNAGLPIPHDFRLMSGITYIDTILISELRDRGDDEWLRLLFHELVHVVQYKALGLEGFMAAYVQGWAMNGFEYEQIPLERQAYRLQSHIQVAPTIPEDIEAKVYEELGVDPETGAPLG